jgi:hypothetical protein
MGFSGDLGFLRGLYGGLRFLGLYGDLWFFRGLYGNLLVSPGALQ